MEVGERDTQGRDHVLQVRGEVWTLGLLMVDSVKRESTVNEVQLALVEHPSKPSTVNAFSCSAVIYSP